MTDDAAKVFERGTRANNLGKAINPGAASGSGQQQHYGPGSAVSGISVAVNWTVTNSGTGTTRRHMVDRVYLSKTASLGTDAVALGDFRTMGRWLPEPNIRVQRR